MWYTDIQAGRELIHIKQNLKTEGRKAGRWLSGRAGRAGSQGSEVQGGGRLNLAAQRTKLVDCGCVFQ